MSNAHRGIRRPLAATVAAVAVFVPVLMAPAGASAAVWKGTQIRAVAGDVTAASLRYAGRTSQRQAVAITTSNSRGRIVRFTIAFRSACRSGRTLATGITAEGISVGRGLFRSAGMVTLPGLEGGATAQIQATPAGRVGRTTVSGTFRATATIVDAAGQSIDTCSTGTIRYTARRR